MFRLFTVGASEPPGAGWAATGAAARGIAAMRGSALLRSGVWAIADQSLISATNFFTMVLLARALSPAAFGVFTLAYAVLLFMNGIQSALITEPHNVLGATRDGNDYIGYTTAIGLAQLLLIAVSALVTGTAAVIAAFAGWSIAPVLVALTPALVAWQLQEFVRRVLYTKTNVPAAFKNDLLSYGGQIIGIATLWRTGHLTPTGALLVLAATSLLGLLLGLWQVRSHLRRSLVADYWSSAIGEQWRFGKWLLGTTLLTWTSGQLYPMLVAGFVSLGATGAMKAMLTIMGPTHLFLNAMGPLFMPRAATAYQQGHAPAARAFFRKILWVTAPLMLIYCLGVAAFAHPVVRLLYGDQYAEYSWFLAILALVYALIYLRTVVTVILRSMGVTAPIFVANLWSTVVVLTLGVAAVYSLGVVGAGLGMIVHGVLVNVILWRYGLRAMRSGA